MAHAVASYVLNAETAVTRSGTEGHAHEDRTQGCNATPLTRRQVEQQVLQRGDSERQDSHSRCNGGEAAVGHA